MFELKVKNKFKDKYTGKVYEVGDTLKTDEISRVNILLSKNLCEVVSVSTDTADTEEKDTNKVSFNGTEYDLDVIKDALTANGVSVAKNAGVKGVSIALKKLSEEETAKLSDTLNKEK